MSIRSPRPTRQNLSISSRRTVSLESQKETRSPIPATTSAFDVPAQSIKKISTLEGHFVAASSEFVGSLMFLFFSFAGHLMITTQASDRSIKNGGTSSQQNIFIALVYGFSLLVNSWAFFRISGGLFNPAVTFGMVVAGQLPTIRAIFLFPAQLLGAICAAALVEGLFPGDVGVVNTSLSGGTTIVQGVFIEAFMTAELVFVVLMLAAEKSKSTFIAPIGIGLALFVAMMGGMSTSSLLDTWTSMTNILQACILQVLHLILPVASVRLSLLRHSSFITGFTGLGRYLGLCSLLCTIGLSSTSTMNRRILVRILLEVILIVIKVMRCTGAGGARIERGKKVFSEVYKVSIARSMESYHRRFRMYI
ncbi:Aquaporin [Pyrenophora teres f. teres]|uniref:Aquaporin n=1 Tax=Pyrenophora teres f. teres TaxID=97479 RepID=A0A6S6W8N0_9PLEO|nr:Aquaporin [Pyrenophora teres f. teres]